MNRDEVIELATKAGGSHFAKYSADVFVRFAEAVAAHEREALDQAIRSVGECGCREWCGCFTPETALNAIRARNTKETT